MEIFHDTASVSLKKIEPPAVEPVLKAVVAPPDDLRFGSTLTLSFAPLDDSV